MMNKKDQKNISPSRIDQVTSGLKSLLNISNKLRARLAVVEKKINDLEREQKFLKSYSNPNITITEVSAAGGKKIYIGKYRLYLGKKPQLVTIYIGQVTKFSGKDDPKIKHLAIHKALKSNQKRTLIYNSKMT